jgi:hypothetical protein
VPTVFRFKGYRFFFFSNEDKEPVHIHVESDDNYAKFWLEPVQMVRSIGYNARELNEIREIIEKNIAIFRRRWDEYFSR